MKKIKYIISFCIIFIALLIIGESHIFHLDNFYTQYWSTTLYLQDGIKSEEMIKDIVDSAACNEVEVFTFINSGVNTSSVQYNIYGTPGVEKCINKNSNIFEKKYTSFFLGSIDFKFSNIQDIADIKNQNEYYVIGSGEKVHKFKMDLINKYAGNHPKKGYLDKESKKNTIFIWILSISIILLLSFYDTISQKKEDVIKITMGERISKIIIQNILLDSFVFIASFLLIVFILSRYTYVFFNFKISIILFGALLIINGLLYLNLYFYDVKEAFSNGKSSRNLLSINYGLKLITTIVTIFIISSNIAFIFESYSFCKQKNFFTNHKDYYHIEFLYKPVRNSDGTIDDRLDESMAVQWKFYTEFFNQFNSIALKDISDFFEIKSIYANRNALNYLKRKITELNNLNLDKEYYFILPSKMKDDPCIIDKIKGSINYSGGDADFYYKYEVIYYDDNIHIVGMDEDNVYGSDLIKNPVIIYNNMEVHRIKSENDDEYRETLNELDDVIYKISSNDDIYKFNKFLEKHNLVGQNIYKINALEKYENMWKIAKRILYINLVFSILVLLLEIIVINWIIKMEYKINAIELSIKKIVGYSILEKNRKIIMMTVVTTMMSILTAVILNIIMKTQKAYYLALGGIVILIFEILIIIFNIQKVENCEIQKILKGGNL